MLISKDRKKLQKRNREQTKEGKAVRSRLKYEMLASSHRSQMIDMKKGERYESGISITEARKCLRKKSKRNIGKKETWTCVYYHPRYCTKLGHKDCRSKDCAMYGKSSDERSIALKEIENEILDDEIKRLSAEKDDMNWKSGKRTYVLCTGIVGGNENN